ncbi:IS5/IS1182 family transposase, partial [Francisella tularensis subsp. novicida]|nr:IS5/IS1182 family transposase [Francisella tularensis subsp. novicida]MWZ40687.1 IS5/IS1182 family transposase [Francisella tularensis]MBK2316467.1 IS5/IS1182 family transposase [Francisella tularensis subsp. novicida]MBK2322009.1 IS5/IS1182 family transposase [Francisella tularensis subsp. novicida]MBK2323779.1 IS5/IS1182 family transposase [Francisella tularensis subsp. novicida]
IENFFSKIKHFRRVFSRFDKTISAYIGMIKLACTFIWLR